MTRDEVAALICRAGVEVLSLGPGAEFRVRDTSLRNALDLPRSWNLIASGLDVRGNRKAYGLAVGEFDCAQDIIFKWSLLIKRLRAEVGQ